jgi:hypothetical protein
VNYQLEPRPVIHGTAAEIAIGEHKADGTHQVKGGSGRNAKAGNVAGVGRDLRLQQCEVQSMWREMDRHGCSLDGGALDAGARQLGPIAG